MKLTPHSCAQVHDRSIYSNPFNPTASISFSMTHAGRIRISVHNIRSVEPLVQLDQERMADRHVMTFDTAHLASGVYHWPLAAVGVITSRTITEVN
jgi:hypothetical protein